MKNLFKILGFASVLFYSSCSETIDYKDYLTSGEIRYAAKPEELKAYPGKERIKLQWIILSDQNITKAKVYWRNKADSLEIPISRNKGIDTISAIIPLQEGSYSFDVVHFHEDGVRSLASNVSSNSYGQSYMSTLINRGVTNVTFTPSNQGVRIFWGTNESTSIGTEINYVTTAATGSQPRRFIVSPTANESQYTRVENNINMEYRTLFKPDTLSIDTFYTEYSKILVKY